MFVKLNTFILINSQKNDAKCFIYYTNTVFLQIYNLSSM